MKKNLLNQEADNISPWHIFGIIKIRKYKNIVHFQQVLRNDDIYIIKEEIAWNITKAIIKNSSESQILLTYKSVTEIGFPSGAKFRTICKKAVGQTVMVDNQEYRVTLCPKEAGPQACRECINYIEQKETARFYVAMKPVNDFRGSRAIFEFNYNLYKGLWLDSEVVNSYHVWNPDDVFIFALKKKISASDFIAKAMLQFLRSVQNVISLKLKRV